jgi:hemolysin activation/secretion protein
MGFAHRKRRPRWQTWGLAAMTWMALLAGAQEPSPPGVIPTFAELEASGAIIGDIQVVTDDVFDLDDPRENNFLYRLANKIHIKSRPSTVRRSLLFRSGEPVSARLVDETERLLREKDYLSDVQIRAVAVRDNVVDIEVRTRDNWSLQPGGSFSREGGSNSSGITLREQNLFGTGIELGIEQVSDVDRDGTEVTFKHDHAFAGWTTIKLMHADYDDGYKDEATFERPFYALDTRWAAGVTGQRFDQIDSLYNAGNVVGQYRHSRDSASAYAGWSRGLIDRWVQRYSLGLSYSADYYDYDGSLPTPTAPPPDEVLTGPFVRWEVVEDDFQKLSNRERISRPEYFAMGFHSDVTVGRALTGLGSTRDPWLFTVKLNDGFRPFGRHDLLTELKASGQVDDGKGWHEQYTGGARYYLPQTPKALFYFGVAAGYTPSDAPEDQLLLGGDNGLRGFPLRYQVGDKRLVFSVEERVYTDWYPFRLFRIGGAVYFDYGRAWGGPTQNTGDPGWLANVGFGLRVVSDRASFGKIYHIDLAFPINNDDPNIKSPQFLIKSRSYF